MEEIFRDIEGYEGLYQVSNLGRVKSSNYHMTGKEKFLKPLKQQGGYFQVMLCKEGKYKHCYVHRLVASTFIENPYNLPQVNHKNEDKTNNSVDNLEWCTSKYNINFGTRTEKVSKQVKCIDTGIVYPSTRYASRQTGVNQASISSCCNGKLKTAGKLHWEYI